MPLTKNREMPRLGTVYVLKKFMQEVNLYNLFKINLSSKSLETEGGECPLEMIYLVDLL